MCVCVCACACSKKNQNILIEKKLKAPSKSKSNQQALVGHVVCSQVILNSRGTFLLHGIRHRNRLRTGPVGHALSGESREHEAYSQEECQRTWVTGC